MWIVKARLRKDQRKGECRPSLALPCYPGRAAHTAMHVASCADDPAANHKRSVAMSKPRPRWYAPSTGAIGRVGRECRLPPATGRAYYIRGRAVKLASRADAVRGQHKRDTRHTRGGPANPRALIVQLRLVAGAQRYRTLPRCSSGPASRAWLRAAK